MFEGALNKNDQNTEKNLTPTPQENNTNFNPSATPNNNQPIDMFAGIEKDDSKAAMSSRGVLGINERKEAIKKSLGKSFIIILSATLLVLGAAGYAFYKLFFEPVNNNIEKSTINMVEKTINPTSKDLIEVEKLDNDNKDMPKTEIEQPGGSSEQAPNDTALQNNLSSVKVDNDSDGDGLTDEEESTIGTNPNNIDSDNDGLTDFEEVKKYQSDPNNTDSDGDGYLDGEEVKNGYNPIGSGKLIE